MEKLAKDLDLVTSRSYTLNMLKTPVRDSLGFSNLGERFLNRPQTHLEDVSFVQFEPLESLTFDVAGRNV